MSTYADHLTEPSMGYYKSQVDVPTRGGARRRRTAACLQLPAVKLDEAPVREEDLLPHNGRAQRRGALKPLLL